MTPEQVAELLAGLRAEADRIERDRSLIAEEMAKLHGMVGTVKADIINSLKDGLKPAQDRMDEVEAILVAVAVILGTKGIIKVGEVKAEVERVKGRETDNLKFWRMIREAGLGDEDVRNT